MSISSSSNLTDNSTLQCCDFYSKGLGYQFTICDHSLGAYILSDKKGDALDLSYLNMPLNDTGFNDVNWAELAVLVNQYCN
jgi:hypothetical protein